MLQNGFSGHDSDEGTAIIHHRHKILAHSRGKQILRLGCHGNGRIVTAMGDFHDAVIFHVPQIRQTQIFDAPQKERTRQFIRHLKVLEYSITSRDFDFIGLNTQIEEFGRKHRVSQRTIYNLQSYIEEMCVQIILPQMKNDFEILVTIEYSEEMDEADVLIRYSGESMDPLCTDNDLSLLLARKATDNITYSFDSEQNPCNRVDAKIR